MVTAYPNSVPTVIVTPPPFSPPLAPRTSTYVREQVSVLIVQGGLEGEIVTHRRGLQSLGNKVTSLTLSVSKSVVSVKVLLSSFK